MCYFQCTSKWLIISMFLIVIGIKSASSLLCYDCNSLFDPRCGDDFDPFSLGVVNCSLKEPLEHMPEAVPSVCRTIKMEIEGKVRVVRQCGYIPDDLTDRTCQRRASTDKLFITYCSCTQDLCNGSIVKESKGTMVLIFCFVIFHYLLM